MPQFAPKTHPARERLLEFGRRWPTLWAALDEARQARPHPPHVYVSDEEGGAALARAMFDAGQGGQLEELLSAGGDAALTIAMHASNAATLAAWRMTQGIYRIDPALYGDLVQTPLVGEIPADVLLRLPEWCVYVETPGLRATGRGGALLDVLGSWARIDDFGDRRLLVLSLDIAGAADPQPHTLDLRGTIQDGLEAIAREYADAGLVHRSSGWLEAAGGVASYIAPIVNLLLYLCSTTDIGGKRGQPGNPAPVRTRRDGWRLFPADGLRTWDVGVRLGAALRRAYQAEQAGTAEHAGPRPHVRRAHWHTILSGPRLTPAGAPIPPGQRRADLRWMPPIPVNVDDVEQLPSVVRRVR